MKIFDFDGLNRNSCCHSGIEKKLDVLIVLKTQIGLIFSAFSWEYAENNIMSENNSLKVNSSRK